MPVPRAGLGMHIGAGRIMLNADDTAEKERRRESVCDYSP